MQKPRPLLEIPFQLALLVLVFVFYSFDRDQPQIQFHQVIFFLNYVGAVLIINYLLLPRFFYKKKYWQFLVAFLVIIVLVILMEELVLERIFFPDGRGRRFQPIFFSLLDVLPVITILSGFKFGWDLIVKQREVEELQLSVEENELKFLKSQIHPHFLFNNLNNLYSYALDNSEKTPAIILEMSSVLRYMLYECKEKFVPVEGELKQLHNFVKLNELQVEDRGKITFTKPEAIDDHLKIAPLILLVFVENAFKHSVGSQSENITIDISVGISAEEELAFVCSNSYRAQANTDDISMGIGLENVKKRLELLYPNAHTLRIEQSPDTYKVTLKIKLASASK